MWAGTAGAPYTAPWPVASTWLASGVPRCPEAASSALIALRRVKSEAKVSPRTPFLAVTVRAPQAQVEALESVKGDLEATIEGRGRPDRGCLKRRWGRYPNPSSWAAPASAEGLTLKLAWGPPWNTTGGPSAVFQMDKNAVNNRHVERYEATGLSVIHFRRGSCYLTVRETSGKAKNRTEQPL